MSDLIAVTGASGVLGRWVVKHLVERGIRVLAFTSSPEFLSAGGSSTGVSYVSRNELSYLQKYEIDCLINCSFPRQDDGGAVASGLKYSSRLFQACSRGGVRSIINISSQSVYSQKREGVADENEKLAPEGGYAMGKFATEILCDFLARNVPHSHIRLASLIGVEYSQRFINYFVKRAIEGKPLIVRRGSQRYGFMDVRDASDAITKMSLTDPLKWAPVYNLGPAEQGFSMDEIVAVISNVACRYGYPPEIIPGEPGAVHNSSLDSRLFESNFDWHSRYSLEETVEDIFDDLHYHMNK